MPRCARSSIICTSSRSRVYARPMRAALLACVLVAGCGGDDGPAKLPDVLLPTITSRGGPVMAHPQIVPIFYSDDPDVVPLTRFASWVGTSQWLAEVGTEYGVTGASVLGVVNRPGAAPDQISNL